MKGFIVWGLLMVTLQVYAGEPGLGQVRSLYAKAVKEEKECERLLQVLGQVSENGQPTLAGYKGCATMLMAKHVFSPFSKMSYFKKGRNMLERAIAADTANVELRVLRLGVQKNAPGFLGYKSNIAADKAFLIRRRGGVDDVYLHGMINKVL